MPSEPESPRQLLLSHLDTIERLVPIIARRQALSTDDAEELLGMINLKMVEDDYAVLRQFGGRSSIESYLASVVTNLARDYRIQKWGKWRPSAKARRLGTIAVQLETLASRDGRSIEEAIEILRRNFAVNRSRRELRELAAELPYHPPRFLDGDIDFDAMASTANAADTVADAERRRMAERVEAELGRALGSLTGEERYLIRTVFRDGLGVTELARQLGTPRQPLFRRISAIHRRLRRSLELAGIGLREVVDLVGWDHRLVRVDFGDDGPEDD